MKGNIIFSRSAWGRNEAKQAIGIDISKGTLGSIDIAVEYWQAKSSYYEHLGVALDEVIVFTQNISPTENGDKVRSGLKLIWDKWKPLITDTQEKTIFRAVLTNTGMFFKESTSIGRKQLREKLLTEICNSVD